MKKYIALLLALVLVAGLAAGCAKEETVDPLYDENMPNKLLVSQVTEFPMATDATTYEQRRQMCLDFFRLSIEFQWKSNIDVEDYVSYYKGKTKGLLTENLYAGIPYGGTSSGNIYRWLEYGTIFLENRYTRIIRKALYHPERTWRNFWRLSRFARIQEILCEVPSPQNIDYDMYRAKNETPPDTYTWEYWLALSLFAQMLLWFSPSQLSPELRETAARFTAWRKKHNDQLLNSEIRRFGTEPDGASLSGLYTVSAEPLAVIFREQHCKESQITVPCGGKNRHWHLVFGNGSATAVDGGVHFEIPEAPGFAVWETTP